MRYWTEDEARAELPRLRLLLDTVRRAVRQATVSRGNGHRVGPDGTTADESATAGRPDAGASGDVDDPDVDAASALDELREKGIVLRDVETGLVDFPAVTGSGVVYLLCWKRDEDDLGWWHFTEEGFAARKPLPLPSDL